MFLGHYKTKLEQKGRVAVPSKFRSELNQQVIITLGYEQSLIMIPAASWQTFADQLQNSSFFASPVRQTERLILGGAFECQLDNQGRVLLPAALKQYAGLADEVVFVGLGARIEIWSADNWQAHQQYLLENSGQIADRFVEHLKTESK